MVACHLVLIGMMGSGKSTVGQHCAAELSFEFCDTDDVIAASSAMTIPEIFAAYGEAEFRRREVNAVRDIARSNTAHVVACGGGVALDPANRTALRARGFVVWLDATPEALASRVGDGHGRPLLATGDPLATLQRLAELRSDAYERAAHLRIDTTHKDRNTVIEEVIQAFRHEEFHAS